MITATNVRVIDPVAADLHVEWTLGRASTCDVVVADEFVAPRQCKVVLDRGVYRVRDLGSTNGTYVGRTGVDRYRAHKVVGDRLWMPGETLWVGQWGIARPGIRPFDGEHVMHFFTADGGLGTWGL